jgi:hypothetical protein
VTVHKTLTSADWSLRVLRRQGLFERISCLAPDETLSPGQAEAIDRVMREYQELGDDAFVADNLERWLS